MSRRVLVVLAAIAALAVASTAPALGNGDSLLSRALDVAQSAERKAATAERAARAARRRATVARRVARQSRAIARRKARRGPAGPRGPAGQTGPRGVAGPSGPGVGIAFAAAAASVSTDSTGYVALGGPSVEVTVPASGVIEVAAQATLADASDDDGAVALFEDGSLMPGQADDCAPAGGSLFALASGSGDDLVGGTPAAFPFCFTLGPPSPVMLATTPGPHTYELRYAVCCGTGTATFSDRRLWITPRP